MASRLFNAAPLVQGEKLTPEQCVNRMNAKRREAVEKGEGRDDIEWVVGFNGQPEIRFVETDFDRLMKRIKAGRISQIEIDRLPFRAQSIAWNRGYLNCDMEKPPRYWLPDHKPTDYVAPPPVSEGIDWWNE